MAFIAVCVVSLIFWTAVSIITGAREPWDLAIYWTVIYPAALALSVVMAAMMKSAQWSAGAIVMFAQIPVMVAYSGVSSLLSLGILFTVILAIPAVILSWLAGRLRQAHSGN